MPGVYLRHRTEQPTVTAPYIADCSKARNMLLLLLLLAVPDAAGGTVLSNAAQCSAGQGSTQP
jgi:hypothetical protein